MRFKSNFVKGLVKQTRTIKNVSITFGGPRDTENIPVYWKTFTSGLSVSISGQHKGQHYVHDTIAKQVCLLKGACVGAFSGKNVADATHVVRKIQPFTVDCTLCRIKQMLVLKNG